MKELIIKAKELCLNKTNKKNAISCILIVVLFLLALLYFFQNISSFFITIGLIILLVVSLASFIKIENKKFLFKANVEINSTFIIIIAYVLYIFFSSKLIDSLSFSSNLINELFIIISLSLLLLIKHNKKIFIKCTKGYIFIMFLLLFICVSTNFNNCNRGIMYFFGQSYDPNYLGLSFILPTILSLFFAFKSKGKIKIFYIIFVILSLFYSVLSGSRGTTISLLAGISIYFVFKLFGNNKKLINKKNILIFLISLLIILTLFSFFVPDVTLERFKLQNMSSFGGRLDIWKKAIQTFKDSSIKNMLLGNGIGSFRTVVSFYLYGYYLIAHNFLINAIIEVGIFGVAILFMLIGNIILQAIKKKNYFVLSLIISTILMYLTLDLSILFWIVVILCTIILNNDNINKYFIEE